MKSFIVVLMIIAASFSSWGKSQPNSTIQTLSKIIQKQAKEIKALKAENAALKQGKIVSTKSKNVKPKLSAAALKYKIEQLSQQIENYQSKARNVKHNQIKLTKNDILGWKYKKGEVIYPMSRYSKSRKRTKIIYITKDEKRAKLKKGYLNKAAKLKKQKAVLLKQLASLR